MSRCTEPRWRWRAANVDRTIAHAREALALAPPGDDLTRAAAGALAGLASWTTGDLAGAHAAYTESTVGLTSAGFLADVLGCTITLGDIRRTQGRLDDAAAHAISAHSTRPRRHRAASRCAEPPTCTSDWPGCWSSATTSRAPAEHLAISERLGEDNGLPQNAYRWRVVMARLRAAEGELDDALALLDEAERVYDGDYSPDVQPVRGRAGPTADPPRRAGARGGVGPGPAACLPTTSRPTCASTSTSPWPGC